MTPREWLALLFFYILYLLVGGCIFQHINLESIKYDKEEIQRSIDIYEMLTKTVDAEYQAQALQVVGDYCGKPLTNPTEDSATDPVQRSFILSFYQAFIFSCIFFLAFNLFGYGFVLYDRLLRQNFGDLSE